MTGPVDLPADVNQVDGPAPELVRVERIEEVRPFDMIDEGLFVTRVTLYPARGSMAWVVQPIHKGWREIEGHRFWEPVYGDPVDIEPTFPRTVIRGADFPQAFGGADDA